MDSDSEVVGCISSFYLNMKANCYTSFSSSGWYFVFTLGIMLVIIYSEHHTILFYFGFKPYPLKLKPSVIFWLYIILNPDYFFNCRSEWDLSM